MSAQHATHRPFKSFTETLAAIERVQASLAALIARDLAGQRGGASLKRATRHLQNANTDLARAALVCRGRILDAGPENAATGGKPWKNA